MDEKRDTPADGQEHEEREGESVVVSASTRRPERVERSGAVLGAFGANGVTSRARRSS
jgi:hypothetical protein